MRRTFHFGTYSSTVAVLAQADLDDGLDDSAFFVADTNTERYLPSAGARRVLPAGETSKSWTQLELLLRAMLEADLTRTGRVAAVGGGVVCDIAALAASLYMRGCTLVLVPTSLLAMVDAAVGGKTGIDFGGYKNMVGTFYPASEVRICTDTLATLSEREYRSGLAEVIKTAMLGDEDLLDTLDRNRELIAARDPDLLAEVVWACVEVKGGIVEADLTERGVRAFLNLGHTFAHALESVVGLGTWTHGEAVAWGLARAMELGERRGTTDPAYAARVLTLLDRYGYAIDPMPELTDRIVEAMRRDKKRRGDEIRFILQERAGRTLITAVETGLVESVLRSGAR